MRNEEAVVLGIGVVLVVIGVAMVVTQARVRSSYRRRVPQNAFRTFVRVLGWGVTGLSATVLCGLAFGVLIRVLGGDFNWEMGAGVMAAAAVLAIIALGGVMLIAVAPQVGAPPSGEEQPGFEKRLAAARFVGWTLIVVPCIIILPLSLFAFFLIGAAFLLTLAANKKANLGTLLWLLAVAVDRQLPLAEEVEALAAGETGSWRRRLYKLADLLRMGVSLPEALDSVPGLVPRSAVTAAYVGQESGTLAQALRGAAVDFNASQRQRWMGNFSGVSFLLYLWLMVSIVQGVVGFQMYFIIPKFKKIFDDFGVELPQMTESLIRTSDHIVDYFYFYWPFFLLPFVALVMGTIGYFRGWGDFDFGVVSRWFSRFDTPGILKNLARSIAARRPIDDGLATVADKHRRSNIRLRLGRALAAVQQGEDCWQALQFERIITKEEAAVLHSAQQVGNLPWAMDELARTIERRLSYRLAALVQTLEPICVILIGAVVFFVVVGLFMPLIKLQFDLS